MNVPYCRSTGWSREQTQLAKLWWWETFSGVFLIEFDSRWGHIWTLDETFFQLFYIQYRHFQNSMILFVNLWFVVLDPDFRSFSKYLKIGAALLVLFSLICGCSLHKTNDGEEYTFPVFSFHHCVLLYLHQCYCNSDEGSLISEKSFNEPWFYDIQDKYFLCNFIYSLINCIPLYFRGCTC